MSYVRDLLARCCPCCCCGVESKSGRAQALARLLTWSPDGNETDGSESDLEIIDQAEYTDSDEVGDEYGRSYSSLSAAERDAGGVKALLSTCNEFKFIGNELIDFFYQ
jgi:hypothetical protein